MKIKLLPTIAGVLLAINVVRAQDTPSYLPVFNTTKTIYYLIWGGGATDFPLCGEVSSLLFVQDEEEKSFFHVTGHQIYKEESHFVPPWETGDTVRYSYPFFYPLVKVSEDNSKLWGIREGKEYLLMDMNLQKGDQFSWVDLTDSKEDEGLITVVDIYQSDGRKIIEFDKEFYMIWSGQTDDGSFIYESVPVRFIEGVGCNFWSKLLFAKVENNQIAFEVPNISDSYYSCSDFYKEVYSSLKEGKTIATFSILSSASGNSVFIQFPEQVMACDSRLNIFDSTGRLVKAVSVFENSLNIGVENWSKGVYFFVLTSSGFRGIAKHIKL